MKARRVISMLLAAALSVGAMLSPAWSQDQKKSEEDAIKISAQLVQVDVLVTDKNNRPVSGLKLEDFDLYDNDKLQSISFCSYEESKLQRVDEDNDAPRTLPRAVTPGELKRVVAFVVDTLHISTENLYHARRLLMNFIDTKMEPGDLVLIFPTGGGSGLYQQFTADQRALRLAVNRLRSPFVLDSDGPARRGSSTSQAILADLPKLPESEQQRRPMEGESGGINTGNPVEDTDVRATLAAIDGTINAMSKFPGRKIGVFISEGMRTYRTRALTDLTRTSYRAARANVVFYSIDPAGLSLQNASALEGQTLKAPIDIDPSLTSPTGLKEKSLLEPKSDISDKRNDYYESQEALARIAGETGGKFYRNSNDLKRGLADLLDENSAYYLLGFQPDGAKWDGKFHKLRVAVRNRPDLTVTTRKGYMAKIEKPEPRTTANAKAAEFAEAFSSPLVRRDIDLQLTSFYRDDTKREPFLTSLIHVDVTRLNFKEVDGSYKGKATITGVLMSADGRVADSFSNALDMSYPQKDYDAIRRDGLLITRGVGIKPGVYQMRVLVRENDTGAIGTGSSFIEVPDLKADRLAVSSIFTDTKLLQPNKSDSVGDASSISQRKFPRQGQFAYVLIVYNAKTSANKTQLEISTRLLRNGQVVYAGKPKPVEMLEGSNPPARIFTGGIFQLATLPPDDYILEVTITDKLRKKDDGAVARQEIDFSIERGTDDSKKAN